MTTPVVTTQESVEMSTSVVDRENRRVGRLVVLVPDVWETALLASRIHQVAEVRRQDVLLLGMVSETQSESAMRRKLTLLSAFLQDAGTKTEVRVNNAMTWMRELESLLGDADLLACCDSGRASESGEGWADMLGRRLQRSIYVFADRGSVQVSTSGWLARIVPWIGSIGIILGFLWLQLSLSRLGGTVSTSAWLFASVPAEIGLIWMLNALIG